ncbi:MAG: stage III sporulation protein AE [Clostridia bacterium]|nr:stage III sporulation protein AE [Clostridia bacterium]
MLLVIGLLFAGKAAGAQENEAEQAARSEVDAQIGKIIDGLDFAGTEDMLLSILPGGPDVRAAVSFFASGGVLQPEEIAAGVWSAFFSEVQRLGRLMVVLMLPVLLLSVLSHTLLGGKKGVYGLAHSVGFIVILIPVVLLVISELAHARETITAMTVRMDKLLPLLLTLLTALGGNASSAFLHPMVVAASGSMVFLAREVILRLVMCTCAVTTVNHLSDRAHLTRMARLLRSAVCWLLGVSFTVFLGAMSLQGVCSASIDGVVIRAAKYAVDNFVPVVGGMFSDTMDTLVGCTLIVKNALGVTAVFALLAEILSPMMRTLAVVAVMKLSAALLEPVADGDVVAAIGDFSGTIVLFLITMLCVGTMYFLLIVQMLLVGNLTVMLR